MFPGSSTNVAKQWKKYYVCTLHLVHWKRQKYICYHGQRIFFVLFCILCFKFSSSLQSRWSMKRRSASLSVRHGKLYFYYVLKLPIMFSVLDEHTPQDCTNTSADKVCLMSFTLVTEYLSWYSGLKLIQNTAYAHEMTLDVAEWNLDVGYVNSILPTVVCSASVFLAWCH